MQKKEIQDVMLSVATSLESMDNSKLVKQVASFVTALHESKDEFEFSELFMNHRDNDEELWERVEDELVFSHDWHGDNWIVGKEW